MELVSELLYANTKDTGFTINFFLKAGKAPQMGLLAAPFFTTNDPILALTNKGCEVRLIVRFSPITTPEALRGALDNPRVKVRYFTDAKFHTKLYIVDNVALVGSANLTDSGLKSNRELSVLLRQDRDDVFHELPGIFDSLWNDADVLNEEIFQGYVKAFNANDKPQDEAQFEKHVERYVKPAAPTSVVVGSEKKSKDRTFIQNFRRKYDEILIPAHNEILETALQSGFGRPEYKGQDPQIELARFLGWLRLTQGSGDGWRETPLLSDPKDRSNRIRHYVSIWQSTDNTVKGDMYHASAEIENISNIRTFLCEPEELERLNFDDIFRYLTGCHAFLERLRFVSKSIGGDLSGLERLRIDFEANNSLKCERDERPTFSFLNAFARYAPGSTGAEWNGWRRR